MQVKEVMTCEPYVISASGTLAEAAAMMRDKDIGAVPVYKDDSLVGIITDRDIVVRGVANNWPNDSLVEDLMSSEVFYCFDDQSVREVLDMMGELQIRRVPVLSRDETLRGIVAVADLVMASGAEKVQESLKRISEGKMWPDREEAFSIATSSLADMGERGR